MLRGICGAQRGEHGLGIGKGARRSQTTRGRAEAHERAAEDVVIFDDPDADEGGVHGLAGLPV